MTKLLIVLLYLLASSTKGTLSPISHCLLILISSPNVVPQQLLYSQGSLGFSTLKLDRLNGEIMEEDWKLHTMIKTTEQGVRQQQAVAANC
ncbi:hypothetical protein QL285_052240 [Trifolium repens]|nr:hypothetical protein QL285_052239 [Trifolium repens]KAK2402746.1 hypothetical protein QL285_052240 [Trifolium repens]